ncbi:MAG: sulfatase [Solirubrobacteraceae bacterium]
MTGRRLRTAAIAAAALVVAAGAAAPAQARPAGAARDSRPNVLVVMTDDQALTDLKSMPNVQRLLVRQGTRFTDAITSFPLCCPSRASFLTGQYAHNHGVSGNFAPSGYYGLTHKENTLPRWLQRAGYHTALVGKYLNGYGARNPREIPPGYSEWHGALDLSSYDYFNFTLNENGKLHTWGDPGYAQSLIKLAQVVEHQQINSILDFVKTLASIFTPGNFGTKRAADYSNDVTAGITNQILRRQAKSAKPFFVWWAPAAPHREDVNSQRGAQWADPRPAPRHEHLMSRYPLPRTAAFNEADVSDKPRRMRDIPPLDAAGIARLERNHAGRLAALQSVDEGVARLVATLKRTGQYDNTVILFVSDNGWVEGQHRIPGDKFVPYEESVHVPLVMVGPGIPANRAVRAQVAANVDLTPTVLALAKGRAGRTQDGLSLLPFISRPSAAPERTLPVEATGKLFAAEGFPQQWDQAYSGLRSKQWKYIRWSYGDRELYDLKKDPAEMTNLANDPRYAATVAKLERTRAALARCRGRACDAVRG